MRFYRLFSVVLLVGVALLILFNFRNFSNFHNAHISKLKQNNSTKFQVQKFCSNYRIRERINPNYFYHYQKAGRGLLWCKVPKVGSTTLTKLYLRLAGVVVGEDEHGDVVVSDNSSARIHKLLRDKYPKLVLTDLRKLLNESSTIKFMVSRDPFERLVSAYRDKLEDRERDLHFRDGYYYENYGKLMLPAQERNSTRAPSWSEFIAYLLKTSISRYDEHWMPMSRLCSLCATQYDYIIKLDHFQDQIQRPLKRAGINAPNVGWSHRTGSGNRWIINKYFNKLTLNDIKRLYVKYKRDFQLFGYKPYKYFKLGNKLT